MLKIEKRQNILEVGAGSGYLYHHAMMRKHPSAHYTATDLSDEMLVKLCSRIDIEYIPNQRVHHSKYNLSIERANGENLPFHNDTFDCYIANLCLQITTHPNKWWQKLTEFFKRMVMLDSPCGEIKNNLNYSQLSRRFYLSNLESNLKEFAVIFI